MQLSPLQLLEYAFEGVSVTPDAAFKNEERNPSFVLPPSDMNIQAESGISTLSEQDHFSDYGLKLVLKVSPKAPASAPYSATVAIQGAVRMHMTPDMKGLEDRRQRALVNGISLLYGLVRDMVSSITSRSTHGQMLLPTLNFSSLATQPSVSMTESKPKRPGSTPAKKMPLKPRKKAAT